MADRNIYFIGIAIAGELCSQIEKLQEELASDKGMLDPIVPHVTLLHPNCLSGIMPDEFIPAVREVADRYLPLALQLQDVSFFDDTVAFISVESHKLRSLQHQLVRMLPPQVQEAHFKRPYTPHITIAQIHKPRKLDKEEIVTRTNQSLQLPQTIQIDSLAHFQRIVPRNYKPAKI